MSLTPQRIMVAGGAGFIGNCFVKQLVQRGIEVLVIDALTYAGHKANLEWIEPQNNGNWKLVEGNINDDKLLATLLADFQPDAIVNFAAESHVDNSINSPGEFITTNICGTYVLLQATRAYWHNLSAKKQKNFRYLQISTDEIYGSLDLDSSDKFSENSQIDPRSPYSASKAAADHLVSAWYHTYGLPTIRTNCTNNYGPRQHPEKLIPRMITNAIAGIPLPIYGDGKNIRDWIHVEDHCNGIYLALTKGEIGQNYCFGGNAERHNIDVVTNICQILNELLPSDEIGDYQNLITFVADRAGHDRRYAMDDSKAVSELGYTRQYSFDSGLRQTVKWYLENRKWCDIVTAKKTAA